MLWTIEPVPLHRVQVPGPEVLFQRGFFETIELVIHAFVLRGGPAICLVDTGLPPDYSVLNREIRSRKGEGCGFHDIGAPLPERLRSLGVQPELVVLTSFGPYATGNLDAFAGLPLYVSARGCDDLERPEEVALAHPLPVPVGERLLGAHRIAGEFEVLPGLTFIEVGVHHPASAAVLVDTAQGLIGIADPVFVARNLLDGSALGVAEHAAQWHSMVRNLGARCDALLPIHDPSPIPLARAQWHASLSAPRQ